MSKEAKEPKIATPQELVSAFATLEGSPSLEIIKKAQSVVLSAQPGEKGSPFDFLGNPVNSGSMELTFSGFVRKVDEVLCKLVIKRMKEFLKFEPKDSEKALEEFEAIYAFPREIGVVMPDHAYLQNGYWGLVYPDDANDVYGRFLKHYRKTCGAMAEQKAGIVRNRREMGPRYPRDFEDMRPQFIAAHVATLRGSLPIDAGLAMLFLLKSHPSLLDTSDKFVMDKFNSLLLGREGPQESLENKGGMA